MGKFFDDESCDIVSVLIWVCTAMAWGNSLLPKPWHWRVSGSEVNLGYSTPISCLPCVNSTRQSWWVLCAWNVGGWVAKEWEAWNAGTVLVTRVVITHSGIQKPRIASLDEKSSLPSKVWAGHQLQWAPCSGMLRIVSRLIGASSVPHFADATLATSLSYSSPLDAFSEGGLWIY